jgi:glycosyltransferase involved in cell wall biosynthesis
MTPYFSIIIPSYNRATEIGATIASLVQQDFKDWELILVDDGSTDRTRDVISGFSDPRIHYVYKENGERGAARNFGARMAKGRYLNFFDSDDLMHSFHLREAHAALSENPRTTCLCFPWEYYSANGKYVGRREFKGDLNAIIRKHNFIHLNGSFIARETFLRLPFVEDRAFNICEDWYYFLRLSLTEKLHYINRPTTKYILHPGSTMTNMKPRSFHVAIAYFEGLINENPAAGLKPRFIFAELNSMLALAYALNRQRSQAIRYLWKATCQKPRILFTKRTLGIFKNLLHAKRRS